MPGEPIITADSLSKTYRIWTHPAARLTAPLWQTAARCVPRGTSYRRRLDVRAHSGYRDFKALQPLSFTIRRGEATGIIGRNGSGKSTLLQLIAGTLTPSTGGVTVNGRVAALLELGSGFNPDFTGRENVFLNGAILGFSRREMEEKFDEIAAFADIGAFIEEPVKTYSSGMMMRLAFAVAVCVQPDVLIIDEALSVGDVFFTQRCFQRIREIVHRGATLIFVSHDTAAVQNLCDRGLLLHDGKMVYDGAPEDCVSRYFNLHQPSRNELAEAPLPNAERRHPEIDAQVREALVAADVLSSAKTRHGDRGLEFIAAAAIDGQGSATWDYETLHRSTIRVLLRANQDIALPSVGLQVHDRYGNLVFAAGTPQLRFDLPALKAGEEIMLDFRLTLNLHPSVYSLSLDAAELDANDPNIGNFFDRVGGLGPLTLSHNAPGAMPFYGIAQLPMDISYA